MRYRERLLDMYENPPKEGRLEDGVKAEGENPSCGDKVKIYLQIEDGKVKSARHQTDGCVVSTVVAAKTCEMVEGMPAESASELEPEEVTEQVGFEPGPGRRKCVELPLKSLKKAIGHER